MDLRVEKTQTGIINAFLGLRAGKPLEKITVKELCERARINKSTFYTHYADLYALSDALETEVVNSVISNLSHPEYILERPAAFIAELSLSYHAQDAFIQILFSGSRSGQLICKLEKSIKELVFQRRPEYTEDTVKNIILSYLIYGGYYAYDRNRAYGMEQIVPVLGKLAEAARALLTEDEG